MSRQKTAWKDVRAILIEKDAVELVKLISDLYSLSADNNSFINARYCIGEKTLEPYRSIISDSLYPDIYKNKQLKISKGKKAISNYFKATKDKIGQLELMVHYLESGNQFTADFGDIDGQFYSSLESMLDRILIALRKQPRSVQDQYALRLEDVVLSSKNIGWGYHDYISDVYHEYVSEQST